MPVALPLIQGLGHHGVQVDYPAVGSIFLLSPVFNEDLRVGFTGLQRSVVVSWAYQLQRKSRTQLRQHLHNTGQWRLCTVCHNKQGQLLGRRTNVRTSEGLLAIGSQPDPRPCLADSSSWVCASGAGKSPSQNQVSYSRGSSVVHLTVLIRNIHT